MNELEINRRYLAWLKRIDDALWSKDFPLTAKVGKRGVRSIEEDIEAVLLPVLSEAVIRVQELERAMITASKKEARA